MTRDPFEEVEEQMFDAGFNLNKIPQEKHEEHLWADGLLLWWSKHKKLPTAFELAEDMFDEWDDPVSVEEAEHILAYLKAA